MNYPFPNFSGTTVEIRERISNFIPHFNGHVMTDPFGAKSIQSTPFIALGGKHSEFREISRDLISHFEWSHQVTQLEIRRTGKPAIAQG